MKLGWALKWISDKISGTATRERILNLIEDVPGIHGYAMSQKLGIGSATLYTHLFRLEHDEKLIRSERLDDSGRRGYHIATHQTRP